MDFFRMSNISHRDNPTDNPMDSLIQQDNIILLNHNHKLCKFLFKALKKQ